MHLVFDLEQAHVFCVCAWSLSFREKDNKYSVYAVEHQHTRKSVIKDLSYFSDSLGTRSRVFTVL